jgi:hypothetical protein
MVIDLDCQCAKQDSQIEGNDAVYLRKRFRKAPVKGDYYRVIYYDNPA